MIVSKKFNVKIDKKLIDNFVNITSMAAIACHKYIGKNDKIIADKAATTV